MQVSGLQRHVRRTFFLRTTQRGIMKDVRSMIGSNIASVVESTKGTIFELMAKNMNEKDVKKFFGHWSDKLSISNVSNNSASPTTSEPVKGSAVVEEAQKITHITFEPLKMPASRSEKLLYHPLLGELVTDVGYKRIYMTSVHALARTPVWKKQRILRPERAALIADDKLRKGLQNSLPGVITLYQDTITKEIGIIDGQHRAGALMILAQRGHWNDREHNVVIEVFPTEGEAAVSRLFSAINAAEPVRLIDMPDEPDEYEDNDEDDVKPVVPASKPVRGSANAKATNASAASTVKVDTASVEVSSQPQAPTETTAATATTTVPTTTESNASTKTKAVPKVEKAEAVATTSEEARAPVEHVEAVPQQQQQQDDHRHSKKAVHVVDKDALRDVVTNAVESLRNQYPAMFKATSRCKAPHVNTDVLRDDLFTCLLSLQQQQRHQYAFGSDDSLLAQLALINATLRTKYAALAHVQQQQSLAENTETTSEFTKSFQTALQKAQKHDFFLGLDKQWLHEDALWQKTA